MTILLTGAAGFIGYHVGIALLARGEAVIGVDNINDYYDVRIKQARLDLLREHAAFDFVKLDIAEPGAVRDLGARHAGIDRIVHLAAQAGVRHSLLHPFDYVTSNVTGHLALLELARSLPDLRHFVYASSSSVYGANASLPFREDERVDTPLSLYAATKRSGELMSHAYSQLFGIRQTGLRFFTVYGPWGRPDMAYYSFAAAIVAGRPITLFEGGQLKRDFTYIDDIVAGVIGCLDNPPAAGEACIMNIGNNRAERVETLVRLLEQELGRRAVVISAPRPLTDVEETFADVTKIRSRVGFEPSTPLAEGIPKFAAWFRAWHDLG